MTNSLQEVDIKIIYLNIIVGIHDKPTAYSMVE
jgi:hypothetical protein